MMRPYRVVTNEWGETFEYIVIAISPEDVMETLRECISSFAADALNSRAVSIEEQGDGFLIKKKNMKYLGENATK